MLTPREYDVMLGQFLGMREQIEQGLRLLQLLKPQTNGPIEEHGPGKERITKTFGKAYTTPVGPDEAAARAIAPADSYISSELQGSADTATSAKGDVVGQEATT